MEDDYWGESAEYCLNGLMRRGAYQNFEWAKCSVENYEDWHKLVIKDKFMQASVSQDSSKIWHLKILSFIPISLSFSLHRSLPCLDSSPTLGSDAAIPQVEVNVAFRSKVEQSSTFISQMAWGPHKAVDGPLIGKLVVI